jgi:hypothetical protein
VGRRSGSLEIPFETVENQVEAELIGYSSQATVIERVMPGKGSEAASLSTDSRPARVRLRHG